MSHGHFAFDGQRLHQKAQRLDQDVHWAIVAGPKVEAPFEVLQAEAEAEQLKLDCRVGRRIKVIHDDASQRFQLLVDGVQRTGIRQFSDELPSGSPRHTGVRVHGSVVRLHR